VITEPQSLDAVRGALSTRFAITDAESTVVPTTTVPLEAKNGVQIMKLVEKLEDLDDVQRVHTNTEFSEDVIAEYENAMAR
jgi:transcriptional/translational regulatory protein YebC/TACO1